jgi:hypothetical protein
MLREDAMTRISICLGAVLCACAQDYGLPMTKPDLLARPSGAALAAYLGQPNANPSLCDPTTGGLPLASLGKEARDKISDGLKDGAIAPAVWRGCMDALLPTLGRDDAAAWMDSIGRAYRDLLTDRALERDPALSARVQAMAGLYRERPSEIAPHREWMDAQVVDLRRAIAAGRLGPTATRFGKELLDAVDLEHGLRDGRVVDAALLDRLREAGDEAALRACALRLPDPGLRVQAKRRVIEMGIAASRYPEVREHAAEIESLLLAQGSNPVALAEQEPLSASLDAKTSWPSIVIRQQLERQTVTLLTPTSASALSVLPELTLRGRLWVTVDGISQPVTICAPVSQLDPSPCVPASAVAITSPIIERRRDGTSHLREQLSAQAARDVARSGASVGLPIWVAGKQLATLALPLRFERPGDLVWSSGGFAGVGPQIAARVDATAPGRLILTVAREHGDALVVLERGDAAGFHVVSRGGPGWRGTTGSSGMDGTSGSDGSSASCPSFSGGDGGRGGDGSSGGRGGNGGPGGPGGDIQVELLCTAQGADCDQVERLVRQMMLSQGGPGGAGGAGGSGGRGGRGGRGGSGTTCTNDDSSTSLSGGSDGPSGSDGAQGSDGASGAPGAPGRVELVRRVP